MWWRPYIAVWSSNSCVNRNRAEHKLHKCSRPSPNFDWVCICYWCMYQKPILSSWRYTTRLGRQWQTIHEMAKNENEYTQWNSRPHIYKIVGVYLSHFAKRFVAFTCREFWDEVNGLRFTDYADEECNNPLLEYKIPVGCWLPPGSDWAKYTKVVIDDEDDDFHVNVSSVNITKPDGDTNKAGDDLAVMTSARCMLLLLSTTIIYLN